MWSDDTMIYMLLSYNQGLPGLNPTGIGYPSGPLTNCRNAMAFVVDREFTAMLYTTNILTSVYGQQLKNS